MDLSALTGVSSQQGSASQASSQLAANFDTFLTLLTTQLQNQDPLEPLDSNEFTAQLVQFASVEQEIQANQNLESLITLSYAGIAGNSVSYIGQEVDAIGDTLGLEEGGTVQWAYAMDQVAESSSIVITDQSGKVVYTGAGETASGRHEFLWDGKDNAGEDLPAGLYTIEVNALDSEGAPIPVATSISGIVTSVTLAGDQPILSFGGVSAPLSDVLSVAQPDPTS